MTRILNKIPEVNDWISGGLKLEKSDLSELQYLKDILNFSEVPVLEPLSDNFTLETCLNRIVKGLEYHKTLLKVISKLGHFKSEELDGLLYDIRDLLVQIHKMQKLIEAANVSEQLSESQMEADLLLKLDTTYMTKVAAHLALIQLKMFGENVSRTLRSMIV
ncbi:colony stimulating factor 3 (granulocyte) a [Trichomycterus rosablanca]|uniref:colony stimulating factor 3 (granulocyte) a n=1 Tax=Trichomycterus rosablanca TaxID=2290929 RepID=UPI002F3608A6